MTNAAEDLLAAVARIRPLAEVRALDAERDRTLHPEVVAALHREGIFAVAMPSELGGREVDLVTQLTVFEALAHADASAGWCAMIGALLTGMMGGYLPDAGVARVFSGRTPIGAGLQQPLGVARAERRNGREGYLVEGRWGFGSGIRHSDWIFTAARVVPPDGAPEPQGMPPMILVAVPTAQAIIESTWDTVGLRGTGSEHYRLEGVFVEEELTCSFPAAAPRRGGALFALPFLPFVAAGHLGFALGVARRALDEIQAVAPQRTLAWTQNRVSDQPSFRDGLGRAHASLCSARAWSREVLGDTQAIVARGAHLLPADWAPLRLAITRVTEVCAEVAMFAFRAGGAPSLEASSRLQRCLRDLNAATQHVIASPASYDFAGAALLGAAPFVPMHLPRAPAS